MSKPQDGFVSRFLNRPISSRVTSFLLKFPIHPNAWTIAIFVLPLIAGAFLVRGDYASVLIGAAIFQIFSILDSCDREIARAKNLESNFGERLDSFCDFLEVTDEWLLQRRQKRNADGFSKIARVGLDRYKTHRIYRKQLPC